MKQQNYISPNTQKLTLFGNQDLLEGDVHGDPLVVGSKPGGFDGF